MAWDQVATRLPFPSGRKNGSEHSCQGYHTRITQLVQTSEELVFRSWGKTGPRDREAGSWPKTQKSNTKIFYALQAKAIGVFRPNREKDELTYALGTAEHSG